MVELLHTQALLLAGISVAQCIFCDITPATLREAGVML